MKRALALLFLSACASVVPSTAIQLASLDPLTADPAAIEIAVILPAGFATMPGSARLDLAATRGDEHLKGSFLLQDIPATAGVTAPVGSTAQIYALAKADVDRMRALQRQIAVWKREGEAKGSLGLGLGGCTTGDGPAPDATGSVLIRLAEDGPFLPLIRNGRLSDLLGAETLAAIQPCKDRD